jgi:hypothetical protein
MLQLQSSLYSMPGAAVNTKDCLQRKIEQKLDDLVARATNNLV